MRSPFVLVPLMFVGVVAACTGDDPILTSREDAGAADGGTAEAAGGTDGGGGDGGGDGSADAAPPRSPIDLFGSDVLLWLSANDATSVGMPADGIAIATWQDLSGHLAHAQKCVFPAGSRPVRGPKYVKAAFTRNGKTFAGLRMQDTDDNACAFVPAAKVTWTASDDVLVAVVATGEDPGATVPDANRFLASSCEAGKNTSGWFMATHVDNVAGYTAGYAAGVPGAHASTGAPTRSGTPLLLVSRLSATTLTARAFGAAATPMESVNSSTTRVPVSGCPFYVGGAPDSTNPAEAANPTFGTISEIVVVRRASGGITKADAEALEGALRARYGL